jgi:hypothetical protein
MFFNLTSLPLRETLHWRLILEPKNTQLKHSGRLPELGLVIEALPYVEKDRYLHLDLQICYNLLQYEEQPTKPSEISAWCPQSRRASSQLLESSRKDLSTRNGMPEKRLQRYSRN